MINSNNWTASFNYPACDSNSPINTVRTDLNLRAAMVQVTIVIFFIIICIAEYFLIQLCPMYAHMKRRLQAKVSPVHSALVITENGRSFARVEMSLKQLQFQDGRIASRTNIGTWMSGMPGSFKFEADKQLMPLKKSKVYRVAVVLVSKETSERPLDGRSYTRLSI